MFSSKSLFSWKNIFASYHEPLPLSKQQSQNLLEGLKASFRNQLDREYGQLPGSPATSTTTSKPIDAGQHLRQSAANRHLKDILSNPLFSYNKDTTWTLPSTSKISKRDPMDDFDHAVARGMMTLNVATGCMIAKKEQLQSKDCPNTMAKSQTARRIVQWLRSTGAEKDLQFLDHQPFVRALLPFLVAEGMEEFIWGWLSRTVNDTSGTLTSDKQLKRSSWLLVHFVNIKSRPKSGDLDAAITTMIQAQQMFKTSPLLSELLVRSWRSVSWYSTVEASSRTAPSEKLFDAHIATADCLSRSFPLERAHLHLHHPTHPDHTPALRFFEDKERLRRIVNKVDPSTFKTTKFNFITWLAFFGRDTVVNLNQSGKVEEARVLSELLQTEVINIFNDERVPA